MFPRRPHWGLGVFLAALAVAAAPPETGTDKGGTLHDDFESARVSWKREETDTTIRLLAHDRSNRAAHDGRLSEHFQFDAGPGSEFYYSYALPKIPVTNDLRVDLYVRSNRAGVQLKGRVVLPADKDPDTGQPSYVLVQGPIYQNGERWQKLQLLEIRQEAERQARILRASTRRPVVLDGAYLDRLVINLYGGPGASEVFLDDLTIKPVPNSAPSAVAGPPVPEPALPRAGTPRTDVTRRSDLPVQLVRNRLSRDGHPWVFTAIHAPGADIAALRRAGFDLYVDDVQGNPKRAEKAVSAGMKLMPLLAGKKGDNVVDPAQVASVVEQYPHREAVAIWHLGTGLGRPLSAKDREAELERVRKVNAAIHRLDGDFSRLTTAEVEGETEKYTRAPLNLDVLGIRPLSWGGSQHPHEILSYLGQRRNLAMRGNAEELFWAWIPARPPESLVPAIWGDGKVPDWGYPRVQPEQVRLNTYLALSAGYRGIGYLADADLASDAGQALLIEMELLNEEIDLFESIIAAGSDPYAQYRTYPPDPSTLPPPGTRAGQRMPVVAESMEHPSIKATAIGTRDRKGVLLLVYDMSNMSQFQPPQMAAKELWLTAIAPEGAQAFEFGPGGMRVLESKRGIGGRRIKIEDFGLSTLILLTTDFNLPREIEAKINQNRSVAVQLAIRQAELQLDWVMGIDERIVREGHPIKESAEIFALVRRNIDDARAYLEREDYLNAWTEARRAGRGLRHLMRGHWEHAMETLNRATVFKEGEKKDEEESPTPRDSKPDPKKDDGKIAGLRLPTTSSAAAVAFNTMPQHFRLIEWLKDKSFSRNLVPSGAFDDAESLDEAGWTPESYEYEGITSKVFVTAEKAYRGKGRSVRMTVGPTNKKAGVDGLPPFLDFPAVAMRSPAIPVTAEYLYRISVLVKSPLNSVAGMGGVIVRDSIGGEALQFRTAEKMTDWTRLVIYRRAPEDGDLSVTLGLAAYGDVFFDDFRIERVQELPKGRAPDVAVAPRRQPPLPSTSSAPRRIPTERRSR